MQLDCKMFIMQKCLQASHIYISVQENFVQAVTENIPPLPSSALN